MSCAILDTPAIVEPASTKIAKNAQPSLFHPMLVKVCEGARSSVIQGNTDGLGKESGSTSDIAT